MNTPTIPSAIKKALAKAGGATFVMRPAEVVAYRDPGTVDARPLGFDQVVENVPVVFPGSGGVRVRFPITRGDSIMLLFADISIEEWLTTGRIETPTDPRTHDVTDAVAVPGLLPASQGDKPPTIEFTGDGTIDVGGTSPLATKQDVQDVVDAITNSAVGGADGGATYKANMAAALTSTPAGTSVIRGG